MNEGLYNPDNKEAMDDNARKFTLGDIDQEFLRQHTVVSYTLVMDWIGASADDDRKIVYKKFEDGRLQILLVSKVNQNGGRLVTKKPISEEEYREYSKSAKFHVEKKRFEMNFIQGEKSFLLKYDEFAGSKLHVLEVDAPTAEVRAAFDPKEFPYQLSEVTGNMQFYGSRITEII